MQRELTVARVRGWEEADHLEVLFLESARIYLLERARPDFDQLLDRLREGQRVRITIAPPDGDVIEDVRALPA
jgi:hypothetical protein